MNEEKHPAAGAAEYCAEWVSLFENPLAGMPTGLISILATPFRKYNHSYMSDCPDFDGVDESYYIKRLLINVPQRLRPFFNEQMRNGNERNMRAPCVIGKNIQGKDNFYTARLLYFPSENCAKILDRGVIVSLLKIERVIGTYPRIAYEMGSKYAGRQKFFTNFGSMPKRLRESGELARIQDATFHGKILEPNAGKPGKLPFVEILEDSITNPELFERNYVKLEEIEASKGKYLFYWDLL